MRRKDREMDRDFGLGVIDQAAYGVAAFLDAKGELYSIPLSIVRIREHLYFHSAMSGHKVDALQDGAQIRIVFVTNVQVPHHDISELEAIRSDKKRIMELTSKIFTTEYASAIVTGTLHPVSDDAQWHDAMRAICEKYTAYAMDFFELAAESGRKVTEVYRIDIEELSAKRKKFDAQGVEMKWGRME